MKRQRVELACEKCRMLKAKCDGQQPVCGRCSGYSFECVWPIRRRSSTKESRRVILLDRAPESSRSGHGSTSNGDKDVLAFRHVAESCEALLQSIRPKLDGADGAAVDMTIESIHQLLPQGCTGRIVWAPGNEIKKGGAELSSYFGKASHIHFFNTIRDCMREDGTGNGGEDRDDHGYEQTDISRNATLFGRPLQLPPKEEAAQYLEIYFSTIHVAYPFMSKATVLHHFESIWNDELNDGCDCSWLALLNLIFSIGSYYTSFPRHETEDANLHLKYFEQGLYLSNQFMASCTLVNVWLLLVQCFFFLAVCQTDRCWNTLGFAIRMAQSIGLHVDSSWRDSRGKPLDAEQCELSRRTWYSMYVLDRLLALQLGRPAAINETDFNAILPSRDEVLAFSSDSNQALSNGDIDTKVSRMDYFLHMIRFSRLVGLVMHDLYQPTQVESSPEKMLLSASSLDASVSGWKAELPRHLRFDLGHTFEKSIILKRQRNMLAIKFHHLRALIYRPFLCLPLLQRDNLPFIDLLQRDGLRIEQAEKSCISEAQQIARLLHNVTDEESLVHDFPWWQMIPCLICASSILLVAEAFSISTDLDPLQPLYEDAETCFKVFEALSVNSAAAKKAMDMLKGLAQRRKLLRDCPTGNIQNTAMSEAHARHPSPVSIPLNFSDSTRTIADLDAFLDTCYWQWPSEISNTMKWSAQFIQSPYGSAEAAVAFDDNIDVDRDREVFNPQDAGLS